MASVKHETRNEGRGLHEWDYVPQSEPRVVIKLITDRWRQDESYYPLLEGGGVFQFSEPVLCTYIDQDTLIQSARLSKSEDRIVKYLMRGYSASDIAEHYGITRQSVSVLLHRAVDKICAANNDRWGAVHANV